MEKEKRCPVCGAVTVDEIEKATEEYGYSIGEERIMDFFERNKNLLERIDFVKKEYGTSGFGGPERKPNTIFRADANSKGHKFSYCDENKNEICMHITHKQVAMAISDLIERGEYT